MSILPDARYPKINEPAGSWAEKALPWEIRRWITECRSIEDLFEFISANKNKTAEYGSAGSGMEYDSLAQQQIQTLIAAQTHEQLQASATEMKAMAIETHAHLMALRLPSVFKDPRTYIAFVSGALAGWVASVLTSLTHR